MRRLSLTLLFGLLLFSAVFVLQTAVATSAHARCGACQLIVARVSWDFFESNNQQVNIEQSVCEHPLVVGSIRDACLQVAPDLRLGAASAALRACYHTADCSITGAAVADDIAQRSALEQFFMLTGGLHSWKLRDGWMQPARSYCTWHGVQCSSASTNVSALILPSNGLSGVLPGMLIKQLPQLRVLRLESNNIRVIGAGWPKEDATIASKQLELCDLSNNPLATLPEALTKTCGALVSNTDYASEQQQKRGGLMKRVSAAGLSNIGVNDPILSGGGLTANDTFYNGSFPLHGGGDFSWGAIYAPIFTGDTNGSRDDDDNDNNNNNNNDDNNDNNNNNGIVVMGSNNTIEYENDNININLNLNRNGNNNQNGNGGLQRNTNSSASYQQQHNHTSLNIHNNSTNSSTSGIDESRSTDEDQALANEVRQRLRKAMQQLVDVVDSTDPATLSAALRGNDDCVAIDNDQKRCSFRKRSSQKTLKRSTDGDTDTDDTPTASSSSSAPVPDPSESSAAQQASQVPQGQAPQFPEAPNETPQYPDDGGVFNVDSIFGPIYSGLTNGPRRDIDNDNNNNNNNDGNNNNNNNNQLYVNGQNNRIKYKNRNVNFNFNDNWNDNDNNNRNGRTKSK